VPCPSFLPLPLFFSSFLPFSGSCHRKGNRRRPCLFFPSCHFFFFYLLFVFFEKDERNRPSMYLLLFFFFPFRSLCFFPSSFSPLTKVRRDVIGCWPFRTLFFFLFPLPVFSFLSPEKMPGNACQSLQPQTGFSFLSLFFLSPPPFLSKKGEKEEKEDTSTPSAG